VERLDPQVAQGQVLGGAGGGERRHEAGDRSNGLILYATRNTLGVVAITSFACPDTEQLFRSGQNRRFANMANVALRKLDMLNAAIILADLRVPPANRLKALSGRRSGQRSICVNNQWRICFTWTPTGPAGVEIVDYH